jgi:hypothetical protein
MSAPTPVETSGPAEVSANRLVPDTLANRGALVLAVGTAGLAVLALVLRFSHVPQMESDLVRLLHGMVLIKGLIGLGAAGLVFWRLGGSSSDVRHRQ